VHKVIKWADNPVPSGKPVRQKIVIPTILLFIEVDTMLFRRKPSAQLALDIQNAFGSEISQRTVDRARNGLRFDYLSPILTVQLTGQAKTKRIEFCQFHIQNASDFRATVFSDESKFQLGPNLTKMWRRPGEEGEDVRAPQAAHPPSLMVWGGIGWNFKTEIVFVEGTIDANVYISQIIDDSNLNEDATRAYGEEWQLIQDNAPPHTAHYTIAELNNRGIQILERWPPYSPDLNIIEVIWAVMKRRISNQNPKTLNQLRVIIQNVWDDLSYSTINSLINSMPTRLRQIIMNNGETIVHLN
jgi:transposase